MTKTPLTRGLLLILFVEIFVVGSGLAFSYLTKDGALMSFGDGLPALAVMLALISLVSFFGVLALPTEGGKAEKLSDSRMRFALTAALVLTYLVYFSVAVWETPIKPLPIELLTTLTNLIMVVLPFYFGVTGAVEIARIRDRASSAKESPPPADSGPA